MEVVLSPMETASRGGITGSGWVGMADFVKLFEIYKFKTVFSNTLILSFYSLIAGFPVPIFFALALNQLRRQREEG